MQIIMKGRQQGKTKELIKRSAEDGGYIVCSSLREVTRISELAHQMNLKIPFPLTYNEFVNKKYYGKNIKSFHIDNVELLLQYQSNVKIKTITVTKEEENEGII